MDVWSIRRNRSNHSHVFETSRCHCRQSFHEPLHHVLIVLQRAQHIKTKMSNHENKWIEKRGWLPALVSLPKLWNLPVSCRRFRHSRMYSWLSTPIWIPKKRKSGSQHAPIKMILNSTIIIVAATNSFLLPYSSGKSLTLIVPKIKNIYYSS